MYCRAAGAAVSGGMPEDRAAAFFPVPTARFSDFSYTFVRGRPAAACPVGGKLRCGRRHNSGKMLTKTEAIVLRTVKYSDSRMIVDMFTRETGRVSFAVSVTRSPRPSAVRRQVLQPLALLEVVCDVRPGRQLHRLHSAHPACAPASLSADPCKLSVALFMAEFLCHALRSEQRNAPLFDYIADSIQWLDGCSDGCANFHLVFLMRLSRFLGFFPNLEDYRPGCFFDLRAGCFSDVRPCHHDVLQPDEASRIQLMMRMNFSTMHLYRLSRDERNRLVEVVIWYYRIHIPSFPELRSLAVLRELFV